MKKSFMTRVLAASLSTAMAFSLSPVSNLVTASAASTVQISTTFKTVKVGQSATLKLKNNTLDWKISKVKTTDKLTCTVYGKTANNVKIKGKKVGRATITIVATSAKRKAKGGVSTKNLKCRANVIAADTNTPDTTTFKAEAKADSNDKVVVTFSQPVDNAGISNFSINDAAVKINSVALSDDKKTATLTLEGAASGGEYILKTTALTVDGKAVADQEVKFTTPAAPVDNKTLTLELGKNILKSNGADSTVITCTIRDKNGDPVKDSRLEVEFVSTRGTLGNTRVTAQNGVATTTIRSETSATLVTSRITATIKEATDKDLINSAGEITLDMSPDVGGAEVTTGIVLVDAEGATADRVIAYFDQNVDVNKYLNEVNKTIDKTKAEITIYNNVNNSLDETTAKSKPEAVALLPVPGNPKAMEILVDKPLTNNANIGIKFVDKTATANSSTTRFYKLTDGRQPALVTGDDNGYRKIELEFSEAVLPKGVLESATENANKYVADDASHYAIDGIALDNVKWGTSKYPATVKVSGVSNGEDQRYKVTITLGKDKYGNRIYMKSGDHSVQVSRVGDWAAATSFEKNTVQTNTLNFYVDPNTTSPTIESVDVQSPEQYLVTFNSPVDRRILTQSNGSNLIKLQYQGTDGKWNDVESTKPYSSSVDQKVYVTALGTGDETSKAIVQVGTDWTEYFKTNTTKDNYFRHNFRLVIGAGELENTDNGLKNTSEVSIALEGAMKQPDVDSPKIDSIKDAPITTNDAQRHYYVYLNEPVKIPNKNVPEGDTPSENQTAGNKVPTPTATFIHKTTGESIPGIVNGFATQAYETYDQVLDVTPESSLGEGTWTLVVRAISDDIENTASTLYDDFEVTVAQQVNNFRVLWAAVASPEVFADTFKDNNGNSWIEDKTNRKLGVATYNDIICSNTVDFSYNGTGRYIFVKFSDAIKTYGNEFNVTATENYTLDGHPLPQNSDIRANIVGYDDAGNALSDSITIILPEGSYARGLNAVLNISPSVQSASGQSLQDADHEYKLPYRLPHGNHTDGQENTDEDAVWGNHKTERRENYSSVAAYAQAVQDALNNNSYGYVRITEDLTDYELKINHPVILDLNGNPVKALTYNFTSGGRCEIINSQAVNNLNSTITTLTINTPNADVVLGGQKVAAGSNIQSGITVIDAEVNQTPDDTFTNNARIVTLKVGAVRGRIVNQNVINTVEVKKEADRVDVVNEAGAEITEIVVENGAKDTSIENNSTIKSITVDTDQKVVFEGSGTCENLKLTNSAKITIDEKVNEKYFETTTVEGNGSKATITLNNGSADVLGDVKGETPEIKDNNQNKVEIKDENKVSTDDTTAANAAAKDYFITETTKITTAGALNIVNSATTTTGDALKVTGITVSAKEDGTGAAKYLKVNENKTTAANIGTQYKDAVEVLEGTKDVAAEYITVTGTIEIDKKRVSFEVKIKVNF